MAATLLLILAVVLVAGALIFGITTLISGDDPALSAVDADGRARPLPNDRSLTEGDLKKVRFDLALRGYRMAQVDRVLRRTAYDVGYKDEMIAVLEAEVIALREGRREDADLLRKAREAAASPVEASAETVVPTGSDEEPAGFDSDVSDFAGVVDDYAPYTSPESATIPMVDTVDEVEIDDESGAADETYDPAKDTGPGRLAPRPVLDLAEASPDQPTGDAVNLEPDEAETAEAKNLEPDEADAADRPSEESVRESHG